MINTKEDLTGKRFGKLTVCYQVDDYIQPNGKHAAKWHCICDCSCETDVLQASLKSGNTTSCGCLNKEINSKRLKKKQISIYHKNTYDLTSDDYGIGYTYNGQSFIFDKEDYDKISPYTWSIRKSANKHSDGTVDRSIEKVISNTIDNDGEKHSILLHQLILNTDENHIPDHINGNGLDNRKCNLRIATFSQNCMNRKIGYNNTSGTTGVDYVKQYNKWRARIRVNNKTHHLGYFDNLEDAIIARQEAEEKYFGEFSAKNSRNKIN